MLRFSLKDLLIGFAFVATGLGMVAFAIGWRTPVLSRWEPLQIIFTVAGSIMAGQGLSYPFGKDQRWVGLLIGMAILVAASLVFVQSKTF
jgi:hypothetical protein